MAEEGNRLLSHSELVPCPGRSITWGLPCPLCLAPPSARPQVHGCVPVAMSVEYTLKNLNELIGLDEYAGLPGRRTTDVDKWVTAATELRKRHGLKT